VNVDAEQRLSLVRNRMGDARQALADARLLLDRGSLRGTANRTYYAMFYAVSALALARGEAFKTHAGLISFFQKEYVATGLLGREHGRALQKAFDDRSEADYEDLLDIETGQVETRWREAEDFLGIIDARLRLEFELQP